MTAPLDLLARAARLWHESLDAAGGVPPSSPTPCTAWDLGTLVRHVSESVSTLIELIAGTASRPDSPGGAAQADVELGRLLRAIGRAPRDCPGVRLTALTGAFELTVHAWDINESSRRHVPLPADLVSTLLSRAPAVLHNLDRTGLFGIGYLPAPEQRSDTDRLLALFGRRSTQKENTP